MRDTPCFRCERRRFDCHPHCEEYNDWLKNGPNEITEAKNRERAATPELPRNVVVQIWHGMIRRGR